MRSCRSLSDWCAAFAPSGMSPAWVSCGPPAVGVSVSTMNHKPIDWKHSLRRPGFTLMELMVVVIIIAVLAALGFPLLRNMRASAERTQCMNKLREWGIVIGAYSADHDGKINFEHWPSIGNDPLKASPYIPYWTADIGDPRSGHQYQLDHRYCPSVKWDKQGNAPVCYAMIHPVGVSKVGIQGRVDGKSSDYSMTRITKPSRFMLMIDATAAGYTIQTAGDFDTKVKPLTADGPLLRHNHSVNALFADFSVRQMQWTEIQKGTSYWTTF